jgi:hypothetical protein
MLLYIPLCAQKSYFRFHFIKKIVWKISIPSKEFTAVKNTKAAEEVVISGPGTHIRSFLGPFFTDVKNRM